MGPSNAANTLTSSTSKRTLSKPTATGCTKKILPSSLEGGTGWRTAAENGLPARDPRRRIAAPLQRNTQQAPWLRREMLDHFAIQGRLGRKPPIRLVGVRRLARKCSLRVRLQPPLRPVPHGGPLTRSDAGRLPLRRFGERQPQPLSRDRSRNMDQARRTRAGRELRRNLLPHQGHGISKPGTPRRAHVEIVHVLPA